MKTATITNLLPEETIAQIQVGRQVTMHEDSYVTLSEQLREERYNQYALNHMRNGRPIRRRAM